MSFFQNRNFFIPYDVLIGSYVAYQRMLMIKPKFERVFEFGPGASGMSYFFAQHTYLKDYSYMDVCESFYLLQNMVNTYLFGRNFTQYALRNVNEQNIFYDPKSESPSVNMASPKEFLSIKRDGICNAYPWWKISDVAKKEKYFDFVVSNANLQEFSNECLHDYLILTRKILKDDGILFAQCLGLSHNNTPESLFEMMRKVGLSIMCYYNYNQIFYPDYQPCEQFAAQDVVLAPASESVQYLLQDKNFVKQFRNIYLYDDYKKGDICGFSIIGYEEVNKKGIRNILFVDDKDHVREIFKQKFSGFNFVSLKAKRLIVPILLAIKDSHPYYERYKNRTINFYKMESGIKEIDDLFLFDHNHLVYTKEQIRDIVLDKI